MNGPFSPATGRLLALAATLAVLGLACDGGGRPPGGTAPQATRTAAPAATPTPAPGSPTATATQPGEAASVSDEPVAFMTADGVTVRGHLYSIPGPRRTLVILAHPSDQRSWRDFARELAAAGLPALTFDFRGQGETGAAGDLSRTHLDLTTALLFARSRDYTRIYLVGAGTGGTAALKVAAAQDVAGVVTISSPVQSGGLSAQQDVASVTEPKLFIAGREDGPSVDAVGVFMQNAPAPRESRILAGSDQGTDLLTGASGPELKRLVLDFVSR
jgi:alpha/beta superfamily hydrolase